MASKKKDPKKPSTPVVAAATAPVPSAATVNGEFDYSEMEVEMPNENEPPVAPVIVEEDGVPLELAPLPRASSLVPIPPVPVEPEPVEVDPPVKVDPPAKPVPAPLPPPPSDDEIPRNAEGTLLYSPNAWARKKKREAAAQ
jgi:hypothetical protein